MTTPQSNEKVIGTKFAVASVVHLLAALKQFGVPLEDPNVTITNEAGELLTSLMIFERTDDNGRKMYRVELGTK
jgi:hypothetical protein